jgi:hypothetical protein
MNADDGLSFRTLVDRLQAAIALPWMSQLEAFCRACGSLSDPSPIELLHVRRLATELILRGIASGERVDSSSIIARIGTAQSAEEIGRAVLSGAGSADGATSESEGPDALRRWSHAIRRILTSPQDPCTVGKWAELASVSPDTLRTWCKAARTPVKPSLDLGRVLRAVQLGRERNCRADCFLDVAHPRTLRRLVFLGGIDNASVSLHDIIQRQMFVRDEAARRVLLKIISELTDGSASLPAHVRIQRSAPAGQRWHRGCQNLSRSH